MMKNLIHIFFKLIFLKSQKDISIINLRKKNVPEKNTMYLWGRFIYLSFLLFSVLFQFLFLKYYHCPKYNRSLDMRCETKSKLLKYNYLAQLMLFQYFVDFQDDIKM